MTKYKVLSCPVQLGQVIYKEGETFDFDSDISDLIRVGIVQEFPSFSPQRKPKDKPAISEELFKDKE